MLRVLVVEDDVITAKGLANSLSEFDCVVVGIAYDGQSAIEMFNTLKPELVFIDIELGGGINGISVAEHINKEGRVPFVYITAYYGSKHEHFKRVIATKPANFLPKGDYLPGQIWHFVEDAIYKFYADEVKVPKHILEYFQLYDYYIDVVNSRKRQVPLKEVLYIEVVIVNGRSGSTFHLEGNRTSYVGKPLNLLIEKYPQFVRIHRKYAVNKAFVKLYDKITNSVVLNNNTVLSAGRAYKKILTVHFPV